MTRLLVLGSLLFPILSFAIPEEPLDPEPEPPPCEMPSWSDGTLLRDTATGRVYVVFGGSAFWIPNPDVFAAMGFSESQVQNRTECEIPIGVMPKDETLLREFSDPRVFVTYRGVPLHIKSGTMMSDAGFSFSSVRVVPDRSIWNSSGNLVVPFRNPDGLLFREVNTAPVYLSVGWMLFWIPSVTELAALGYSDSQVVNIRPTLTGAFYSTPQHTVNVRERTGTQVYRFVPGSSAKHPMVTSCSPVRILPAGALNSFGTSPTTLKCPDFAATTTPLKGWLGPATGWRPTLVIHEGFTDAPFSYSEEWLANRYFGPYPSVSGYYETSSFGALKLRPAADGSGAVNNGVVRISLPNTYSVETALSPDTRAANALAAADPFVNFAAFDSNGDGQISNRELMIVIVQSMPANFGPNTGCGMMRWANTKFHDGVGVNIGPYAFLDEQSNFETLVHEVHHVLTNSLDMYYFPISNLDVNVRTCGGAVAFDATMAPSSFSKYLWGWNKPNVVERDGFYNVARSSTAFSSYLLYDTLGNPDDYFLVENREAAAGTYDANIADSGLVVWRVDMAGMRKFFNNGDQSDTPIAIMRPDGATAGLGSPSSNGDAWDTSDPATTSYKTMIRAWRNGTASNVAIRGIGARAATMQIFLDSRSRGLFVEPAATQASIGATTSISVSALSTGSGDTWTVWFGRMPKGWSSGAATTAVGAGGQTTVFIPLTIPSTEAPRTVSISLYASSQAEPFVRMEREVQFSVY